MVLDRPFYYRVLTMTPLKTGGRRRAWRPGSGHGWHQVIQREGIDPTWTVQMVAAIHISLEEAYHSPRVQCSKLDMGVEINLFLVFLWGGFQV